MLFWVIASRLWPPGLDSDSSLLFPLLIAKPASWKPVLRLPQHLCELKSANVDPGALQHEALDHLSAFNRKHDVGKLLGCFPTALSDVCRAALPGFSLTRRSCPQRLRLDMPQAEHGGTLL